MLYASRNRRRVNCERRIEFFRAGAVSCHPNVEILLNLKMLDVPEICRKLIPIVNERRDYNPVRPPSGPESVFTLPGQHVAEFLNTPCAGEIIA